MPLATVFINQFFYLHRSATLCNSVWNLFKHLWRLICLLQTCNLDLLSHTQCNWPLGGEILLLANTWQPKFFFSLPFSVFSWDIDKILSNKSKPPTKTLILLCFNSSYYILVLFISIVLLCDEENGDWDQMANYPPHILWLSYPLASTGMSVRRNWLAIGQSFEALLMTRVVCQSGWQNLAAFRREQKWQWKFSSSAYLQFLRQMRRFCA